MRFRRVLLLSPPGAPAHAALETLRRVVPDCELLWIVLLAPRSSLWTWMRFQEVAADAADEQVAALRQAAATAAREVRLELVDALDAIAAADVEERVAAADIELVVLASATPFAVAAVAEVRRRRTLHVLWAASEGPGTRPPRPMRTLLCDALSPRARQALGAFLREHATPELHCRLMVTSSRPPADLTAALAAEGIGASAELVAGAQVLRDLWRGDALRQPADLLVLTRWPSRLLAVAAPTVPFLVLPVAQAPARQRERAIDLPDLLVVEGYARAHLRYAIGVGRREPIRDQPVEAVAGGVVVAALRTEGGVLELAEALCGEGVGVRRTGDGAAVGSGAHVRVIRPGPRPLVLVDESLPGGDLATLAAHSATVDVLPVRLRPLRSCRAIRARWLAAGLPPLVADAAAVLDEGDALDISAAADAVRLARVASRLRANGYPVAAIVCTGPHRPYTAGFAVLRPTELAEMAELAAAASDSGG